MPYEDKIMVASGDSEHPGEEEVGFETIPSHGGTGGPSIYMGTCTTAADVAAKEATLVDAGNWTLKKGCMVAIKFTNTNTFSAASGSPVTLNVNNTGAKNIYWGNSSNPTGTNTTPFGRANYINTYLYDGIYWVWQGSSADNNTTYSAMSQSEANTGTATTARTITAKVLRDTAIPTTPSNNTFTNAKDFWTAAEALMGGSLTCMFRCKVSPDFGLGNGWYRFIVSEQNRSGNGSYDIEGSIIRISASHITYYSVSNGKDNKDNLVIQRANNYLPERHILTGSGTAGEDKGSGVSPRYFPAKWTFNAGLAAVDGDVVYIKIPVTGHDYGVYVSVDNGTNYYPVVLQGTGRLTTHYTVGDYIQIQFQSDGSAASMFPLNGGDSRVTVSGGAFRVVNYRDSNNSTRQYPTNTTNADYRVLLSYGANDNDETNLTRKDTDFKYNPSTNDLKVGKINGNDVSTSGILSLLHPIGTIIESTTCDTMAKVVAAYGGTTWIQLSGYMLRGATSGVTANSNAKDGGSDTVTLTGAQSGLKGHGHGFTQPTVNGGATNTGGMSANSSHDHVANRLSSYSGSSVGWEGKVGTIENTLKTGSASLAHTHPQVAHTHSVTGGSVSNANASDATSSHSVVPNYKNVYIWERTA